jgi:4-hydroxy-tetrahydrodipicolinate reductase
MGNVVGVHEIHICTDTQTLTLRHEAHDRALFAEGALTAAKWITGMEPGLYDMQRVLDEILQ